MTNNLLTSILKKKIIIKLINTIMKNGKKTKAENIIFNLIKLLKKKNKNPIKFLIQALNNAKPLLVLRIKKKRKITKIIPTPISIKKQINYGIKNLITITKKNNKKNFTLSLIEEILKLYNNTGDVIEYKKKIYTIANDNKLLTRFNKKIN